MIRIITNAGNVNSNTGLKKMRFFNVCSLNLSYMRSYRTFDSTTRPSPTSK